MPLSCVLVRQDILKYVVCSWLLLLLVTGEWVQAQADYTPKFGSLTLNEFQTGESAGDTAEAILLYDRADVTFRKDSHRGLVMTMTYWARVKILKESALSRASVAIPFHRGSKDYEEVIFELKGNTYNLENGSVRMEQMDKKSVKRELISEKHGVINMNLPDVKKGSVIEYSYKRETPLAYRDHPVDWTFQGTIPIKWSEYRIIVPAYLYYKITMGGYLPLHINDQKKVRHSTGVVGENENAVSYRFVVKDAPAFVNEPFITSAADYLSRISFELSTLALPGETVRSFSHTWENVDKTLRDADWFGRQLRGWSVIREIAGKMEEVTVDPLGKMHLAYDFVRREIKWNEYLGTGSREGIRKAFDNKKGSVSDINLFLVSLLRELGLKADPVVLSTRSNGRVHEHIPRLETFNYVVAHVAIGEKTILLDASSPNLIPGVLPERALNSIGRLIPDKGTGRFVSLEPEARKVVHETIDAAFDSETGMLSGTYTGALIGYTGLDWKDSQESVSGYQEEIVRRNPEWEIDSVSVTDKSDSVHYEIQVRYRFAVADLTSNSEMIYFNPMLAGKIANHPLTIPSRIYPVDFTTLNNTVYSVKIRIPDGYEVEELPKGEVVTLPDKGGRFMYAITSSGQEIGLNSIIALHKVSYSADEYEYLRLFFEKIVQKHAQPVILKRK